MAETTLAKRGDIVHAGGDVLLVVSRAHGAEIAYAHPLSAVMATSMTELRAVPAADVVPATPLSLSYVDELGQGVWPSALPHLHDRIRALATR